MHHHTQVLAFKSLDIGVGKQEAEKAIGMAEGPEKHRVYACFGFDEKITGENRHQFLGGFSAPAYRQPSAWKKQPGCIPGSFGFKLGFKEFDEPVFSPGPDLDRVVFHYNPKDSTPMPPGSIGFQKTVGKVHCLHDRQVLMPGSIFADI
jgi:hypothetical protein